MVPGRLRESVLSLALAAAICCGSSVFPGCALLAHALLLVDGACLACSVLEMTSALAQVRRRRMVRVPLRLAGRCVEATEEHGFPALFVGRRRSLPHFLPNRRTACQPHLRPLP